MGFDKWAFLKILEVGFSVACLICKRLTDDEATRLFLYLQKLSREWSLLNNVTWDKVGAAVADTTYGGYVIITSALLIGKLTGELPTTKRYTELVFLGLGALLFVVLGSLEFAALDSVPPDLVDNAAVIGTLSLITAGLFLLDMGGPKAKKVAHTHIIPRPVVKREAKNGKQDTHEIETEIERKKKSKNEATMVQKDNKERSSRGDKLDRGIDETDQKRNGQNGYTKMKDQPIFEKTKVESRPADKSKYGIYGKDADDSDGDLFDDSSSKTGLHSPVWSNIRRGQYGKIDIVSPAFLYPDYSKTEGGSPSGPGDPGYVQYTAQRWGQPKSQKTPRHSPTEV